MKKEPTLRNCLKLILGSLLLPCLAIRKELAMSKNFSLIGGLVLILSIGCGTLFAQATASATLEGTVMDKAQAVVVGATVTVTNKATGLVRTTTTNGEGVYRFELLAAGSYDIKVSASGFST